MLNWQKTSVEFIGNDSFFFLSRQGLIFQVLLGKTLGTVVKFSSLRYSHWSAKQLSTGRTSDICIEWSPVLISYFPKLARAQLSLQQTRGTPEHPASSLYCPHGSYNLFKAHLWPQAKSLEQTHRGALWFMNAFRTSLFSKWWKSWRLSCSGVF